tara:strand:- start:40 stop:759 length:720 start_codon:yes stop_codon:yes gene_type:complete
MDNFAIVMYTHSDYKDLWPMYFGQSDLYIPNDMTKYVIANTTDGLPSNWKTLKYDDSLTYSERLASCISSIDEDYVLIEHEDMVLYDEPDLEFVYEFVDALDQSDYDYIKLLKGGDPAPEDIPYEGHELLFIAPTFSYAVQPTIWKKSRLVEFVTALGDKGKNPSMLEISSPSVCGELKIQGLYSYCGEPKRGMYHWDSDVYPYVATAVVRGKWTNEYVDELSVLHDTYDIDSSVRGFL